MSSGEAKEPEDPIGLVDTHPGLVDGQGLIFLRHGHAHINYDQVEEQSMSYCSGK